MIKNKKRLFMGLGFGIPSIAGLAAATCTCVGCSCSNGQVAIPTSKLDISNNTLKGLKEGTDVTQYTLLEIPSEVRNIQASAFKDVFKAGSTVTTVKFNRTIRKLGDSVFENCKGITTFDLSAITDEDAPFIDWGNNLFGSEESNKPIYLNIKFNDKLSDSVKTQIKNKLLAAGVPAASFAPKVSDKVEATTESKTVETGGSSEIGLKLDITEEQELEYSFQASADRDGGTPGVGVKLGEVKLEKIASNEAKYKATVQAEMVNAKNNGDYVTYKIDMIATVKATKEVKWVQTLENFKLVYNVDKKPTVVNVSSISVNNGEDKTLQLGEEASLSLKVLPENATDKTVTWSSSDTSKVTVDESGIVKAVSLTGDTPVVITATAKDGSGVKGNCKVSAVSTKQLWINELSKAIKTSISKETHTEYTASQISFKLGGTETTIDGVKYDYFNNERRAKLYYNKKYNEFNILSSSYITSCASLEEAGDGITYTIDDNGFTYINENTITEGYKYLSFNNQGYFTKLVSIYSGTEYNFEITYTNEPSVPENKRAYVEVGEISESFDSLYISSGGLLKEEDGAESTLYLWYKNNEPIKGKFSIMNGTTVVASSGTIEKTEEGSNSATITIPTTFWNTWTSFGTLTVVFEVEEATTITKSDFLKYYADYYKNLQTNTKNNKTIGINNISNLKLTEPEEVEKDDIEALLCYTLDSKPYIIVNGDFYIAGEYTPDDLDDVLLEGEGYTYTYNESTKIIRYESSDLILTFDSNGIMVEKVLNDTENPFSLKMEMDYTKEMVSIPKLQITKTGVSEASVSIAYGACSYVKTQGEIEYAFASFFPNEKYKISKPTSVMIDGIELTENTGYFWAPFEEDDQYDLSIIDSRVMSGKTISITIEIKEK